MNSTHDSNQREAALNPQKSFIVQAPAGSGKTELITQRFLTLLSYVNKPEEILAITFTKKSAAEMRARIIHALRDAITAPQPESSHKLKTWTLAKNALKRNDSLQWNLLDNPNRLRIQTIDSFNASLTRQLPILANFGATPEITDDASFLYRDAVYEFLTHLEEDVPWADDIAQLLIHMDNDLNKVATLLMNLLAKRDQWLRYITLNSEDVNLRQTLELHLGFIISDIQQALNNELSLCDSGEIFALANFAAANLMSEKSASPIIACLNLKSIPSPHPKDMKIWLGLASLLLTNEGEWRKRIDKTIGFPASSSFKNASEKSDYANLKQRMQECIKHLQVHDALRIHLQALREAPSQHYSDAQWNTLRALHQVLRIVVAQLKLTFQHYGKIDYIENSQAALTALGTEDNPTDVSLALDCQIQHILIDEFQDTSNSQYSLLCKLIAGWESNDGRTLFIVGDPMQSIYRFREAEVGIFIRARKFGVGPIHLHPLALSVNFRSTPSIVNWINDHFKSVFPQFEDVATGAVSYSQSIAHHEGETLLCDPQLHPFFEEDTSVQADAIVNIIKKAKLENPNGTIAILVRSRTHLKDIIPTLKNANLAFKAIDIDPLTTKPIIQDLMALTKALLQLSNRIAWLAILRAPWCGLSLKDLLIIAGNNPDQIIFEALDNSHLTQELSMEAQQSLARVWPILKIKIAERQRYSLRLWIESTWIMLGGPACLDHKTDLNDALAFFQLLEKLENNGDLLNVDSLDDHVSKLYAAASTTADNTLQIMTIHNAKGLEFDTVILPHLQRKSPNDDKQLLLWMERARLETINSFILAPVHAIGEENDAIYEYIKRQHAIKIDYENGRLLYVAATRAKKALHLLFNTNRLEKSSLLYKIWPSIQNTINQHVSVNNDIEPTVNNAVVTPIKMLKRLSCDWQHQIKETDWTNNLEFFENTIELSLEDTLPKILGLIIHQILQQIALHGSGWWQTHAADSTNRYLQKNLNQLGLPRHNFSYAYYHIHKAINQALTDTRGQWILKSHQKANTELALTTQVNRKTQQIVIDRTFIDENGIRWIIDYKTDAYFEGNLDEFLSQKQQEHEPQLRQYYQAVRFMGDEPVRAGLYFPLIPAWKEWEFSF